MNRKSCRTRHPHASATCFLCNEPPFLVRKLNGVPVFIACNLYGKFPLAFLFAGALSTRCELGMKGNHQCFEWKESFNLESNFSLHLRKELLNVSVGTCSLQHAIVLVRSGNAHCGNIRRRCRCTWRVTCRKLK